MTEAPPMSDEMAAGGMRQVLWRWALVAGIAAAILVIGPPPGITLQGWRLLAIFVATIAASIVRPAPMGAVVFIAVCVLAITGTMTPADALAGYADPIVWLVLCAFMISRSVTKTGLGRRIAYEFIRLLGGRSLGLAYALVATDTVLASVVPSNAPARVASCFRWRAAWPRPTSPRRARRGAAWAPS